MRRRRAGPRSAAPCACVVLLAALAGGCASGTPEAEAPAAPPARREAVSKLVNAVHDLSSPGAVERAIAELREAIAIDPGLWEARYDLGVLLAQQGQLAPAEAELSRAHELAPNAEDVAVALAEVKRRRGAPGAAASLLEAFVKAYPEALMARRLLVVVLREASRSDAALEHAREILLKHPGDPAALAELALTHLGQRQIDIAELLVQEALKAAPKVAEAERAAGLVALERGEDAIAFSHFARATELDRTDTTASLNTATVLLKAGVYAKAVEHFRAVLAVEPESTSAKLGLAACLRALGASDPSQYEAAEALLRQVLERAPEHWAAMFNLALLYSDFLARPDAARPLYRELTTATPPDHPARELSRRWLEEHPEAPAAAPPPSDVGAGAPAPG